MAHFLTLLQKRASHKQDPAIKEKKGNKKHLNPQVRKHPVKQIPFTTPVKEYPQ